MYSSFISLFFLRQLTVEPTSSYFVLSDWSTKSIPQNVSSSAVHKKIWKSKFHEKLIKILVSTFNETKFSFGTWKYCHNETKISVCKPLHSACIQTVESLYDESMMTTLQKKVRSKPQDRRKNLNIFETCHWKFILSVMDHKGQSLEFPFKISSMVFWKLQLHV